MSLQLSPTHQCMICGALWRQCDDFSWNLRSPHAGPCCNNAPMGSQIVPLNKHYGAGYVAATPQAEPTSPVGAVERDRIDAERYRWLRQKAVKEGRDGGWTGYWALPILPAWDDTPYSADLGKGFNHKTLDAAIDAAQPASPAPQDDYWELLYAVARKYPGETRHQTALRYIRQAEEGTGEVQANQAAPQEVPSAPDQSGKQEIAGLRDGEELP